MTRTPCTQTPKTPEILNSFSMLMGSKSKGGSGGGGQWSSTIALTVNGLKISEVVIDPHYEEKHSSSIDDDLILELVKLLTGKFYKPETSKDGFQYFVADLLEVRGARYRLVWLLEDEKLYVGVINAFRR